MLISPAYAQAGGGGGGDLFISLLPIILIFVVFYFLLIRPQQKKVKEHRNMVAALRRGDRVVTAGGVMGQVTKVLNDNEIEVEVAQGVRVRVVRHTISDVLNKSEPATKSSTSKKAAEPEEVADEDAEDEVAEQPKPASGRKRGRRRAADGD